MLTRRAALSVAIRGLAAIEGASLLQIPTAQSTEEDHVVRTDAEWRKRLTPQQYAILRKEVTEPPFTSPLLHEERRGTFACAGCQLDLFSSATKFDSGTGWPSFWAPLDNAVVTKEDRSFFMTRTQPVDRGRRVSRPAHRRRPSVGDPTRPARTSCGGAFGSGFIQANDRLPRDPRYGLTTRFSRPFRCRSEVW